MIIRIVVACINANGEPDFTFVKVQCTEAEYENGDHYTVAEEFALLNGYEYPIVPIDERDPPRWLFEHFDWDKASVVNRAGEEAETLPGEV